ncbi:MAG: hypothetical protein HY063_06025, partial [Bacteroidetes bacterium]|nr:hypothetical protein [Bacteroidota bacterium]
MQNKLYFLKIILPIIFLLSIRFSYSQFLERSAIKDTNYYDIANHFRSKLLNADTTNPDGPYALFKQWESFWSPRLYPTGSFKVAGNALNSFFSTSPNTSSTSNSSHWTELGPVTGIGGHGRILRIAFHPDFNGTGIGNTNTIYAGSWDGGVWRTTDGGQNWSNLNTDKQFALLNVSALSVDNNLNSHSPQYHNIFAGTGNGVSFLSAGIYRSQDDGQTWSQVNSGLGFQFSLTSVTQFAINPTPHYPFSEIFAATSEGLFYTSNADGACNWNFVSSIGSQYMQSVVYHPTNSGTVYAGGTDIFQSIDGGVTWNSMTGGNSGLDFINTAQFPLGTNVDGIKLAVTPDAPNYLYASIITENPDPNNPICNNNYTDRYYWFFIYDGSKWTQSGSPTTTACWNPFPSKSCSNTYCDYYGIGGNYYPFNFSTSVRPDYGGYFTDRLSLAVSPTKNVNSGTKHEIDVGQQDAFESIDEGQSFPYCNGGYCNIFNNHSDINDLQFSPVTNLLYMATDGGISVKTNPTNPSIPNWQNISSGLGVGAVINLGASATDPDLVLIGKFDEGSWLFDNSLPSGQKWKNAGGGDGMEAVIADNNVDMFSSNFKGAIDHYNYDKTTHILALKNAFGKPYWAWDESFDTPFTLDKNTNQMFIGYNDLWEKTNLNQYEACGSPPPTCIENTWVSKSGIQGPYLTCGPIHHVAIAPSNDNYIYVITNYDWAPLLSYCSPQRSRLFKTTQGGGSWTEISPLNASINYTAIHPNNPEKIWIACSGYSSNGKVLAYDGTNITNPWTDYSNGLPYLPVNTIVYEKGSNDGLYVGTDAGVYYRNAGMNAWVPFNNGFPNVVVSELEINYPANKIRAATFGRGLWES